MSNKITDYYMGDKIKVVDVDGNAYYGIASAILWEDETDGEATLTLDVGDREIGFEQSDIAEIEKVE